jgi:hypothetical protein
LETKKKKLASLLTTLSVSHKVNFATRFQNNSSTTTDNIFVDNSIINLSTISPVTNCLSDHNAQIFKTKNTYATINKLPLKQRIGLINKETITNFQTPLKKT